MLVISMVLVHLFRTFILSKKIVFMSGQEDNKEKTQKDLAKLNKMSLDLVIVNFFLGIAVMFLTSITLSLSFNG